MLVVGEKVDLGEKGEVEEGEKVCHVGAMIRGELSAKALIAFSAITNSTNAIVLGHERV